jgi:hypothetical protein
MENTVEFRFSGVNDGNIRGGGIDDILANLQPMKFSTAVYIITGCKTFA